MRSATKNKTGKDKAYLAFIHTLPCIVPDCVSGQHPAQYIEAHHAGDHEFSQKAPDSTAVPLCRWHHRAGPEALHRLGKLFWEHHGIDRDKIIAELNAQYENNRT